MIKNSEIIVNKNHIYENNNNNAKNNYSNYICKILFCINNINLSKINSIN